MTDGVLLRVLLSRFVFTALSVFGIIAGPKNEAIVSEML